MYRCIIYMKKLFAFICITALTGALSAQTRAPSGFSDFFPEAAEINAASRIFVHGFDDAAGLEKVTDGRLVSDVGFTRYERADYSGDQSLSIEVFTLLDFKAAYSLLTLLRENTIQAGPPGDAFTAGNDGFLFSQGRFFIRILGKGAPKELFEKTAEAVSAKMAQFGGELPGLPDYFPPDGYEVSSLRYFPSLDAYKTWTGKNTPWYIDANYDMEIATARYFAENRSGTVSLLQLPTPELAEEYYDALMVSAPERAGGISIYARRAGPLVVCMEGDFDPAEAGRLLSSLNFSYSLRWVYGNEKSPGVIWGIPSIVLKAVVHSIIFSLIACITAVLIGLAIGAGRFALRQYTEKRSPKSTEESTGLTWLNLRNH